MFLKRKNHSDTPLAPLEQEELFTKVRCNWGGQAEVGEIPKRLEELEEDITRQENQIFQLETRLYSLKIQNKRAKQSASRCRSLLSPIRRLPNEILTRILYSESGQIQFFTGSGCKIPVSFSDIKENRIFDLMAVSIHWRSIILSTPIFWSDLSVCFSSNLKKDSHSLSPGKALATLEKLLDRSAAAPLTLVLTGLFDDLQYARGFLNALARHSDRWKAFSWLVYTPLRSDSDETVDCDIDIHGLSQLKSLGLIYRYPTFLTKTLLRSTNLYKVTLGNFYDAFLELPRLQITTLCLTGAYDPPPYRAFGHFPNVENLSIRVSETTRISHPNIPIVMFEKLHTLSVSNSLSANSNVLVALLNSLTAPVLTTLSLSAIDLTLNRPSLAPSTITAFLQRSNCMLLHLTLENLYLEEDELVSLLHSTPSLVTLHITEPTLLRDLEYDRSKFHVVSDKLLHKLSGLECASETSSYPPSILLPNLERLYLTVNGSMFNDKSFVRMVNSRWMLGLESNGVSFNDIIGRNRLRFVELKLRGRVLDSIARKEMDRAGRLDMVIRILENLKVSRV
ncbi:hypothetical protein VKT23_007883 [Stygiomarasmius scandens]|uniref:F-box domain-containing protein n=1 Tax=Marasmiellus scandens TaxID=2682957 RepID=A0ABR1JLE0_9AGAR